MIRAALVIALGSIILGLTLPNVFVGAWGINQHIQFDDNPGQLDATVLGVDAGSPPDRAGMRPGDRIDLSAMTLSDRAAFYGSQPIEPGQFINVPIVRGDQHLQIHIAGAPHGAGQLVALIKRGAATIFVFLAAILVLLRPSRMLWGFYFFALGSVSGAALAYYAFLPALGKVALYEVTSDLYYSLFFSAGLLIFASRFPSDARVGWRGWIDRIAIPYVIVLGALSLVDDVTFLVFAQPVPVFFAQTVQVLGIGAFVLGVVSLFGALFYVTAQERQRLQWVVAAVIVYLAAQAYLTIPDSYWPSAWSNSGVSPGILLSTQVLIPISVAYAVLKHRVLDIRFALSRAVIYGTIFAFLAFCIGLLQVALSQSFGSTPYGLFVDVVLALALGAAMLPLSRFIKAFIEQRIFANQARARADLTRLSKGLPFADSSEEIARILTVSAGRNLKLSAAAVFRRQDGVFIADAHIGWNGNALTTAEADEIKLGLEGDPKLLRLPNGIAGGAAIVAYPLYARRQLRGFALYSAHENGTDLDPDELALLDDLTQNASRGYDALELATRVAAAHEERERAQAEHVQTLERFNEAQSRFVPREFLKLLNKEHLTDVALGDSALRKMTVLFSDIRSFTTLSEGMSPPQIFTFLNRYLNIAGPIVREYGGFIDKYIGDAIMGLFAHGPDDALMAAVALQREVRLHNRRLRDEGLPEMAIGVGLHTGELMLGTIGERGRMETTVIADAVNAASRLEHATKELGAAILLSEDTVNSLEEPGRFLLRSLGKISLRGKHEKIGVYESYDADPPELALHKQTSAQDFSHALALFSSGEVASAHRIFAAIVAKNSNDAGAAYYMNVTCL